MNKQKTLLPTLKEGHRYLVYEVKYGKSLNFGKVHSSVLDQCGKMLGVFDGAAAGIMSAKYNTDKSRGILRVNSKYVDKLKVCLGMIKTVDNKDVIVDCVYVSGMLNKAAERMDA